MLLADKNAVIYGGAGAIGSAVARALAREGARVFLAGRTAATLDTVAADIRSGGGAAEAAVLDALDEAAVDAHADDVAARAGSIDISMNVIQHGDVQGTPMAEMQVADYVRPVVNGVTTTFLTARAAARHMIKQPSGVILMFGGSGDPIRDYSIGGVQTGFHAIEAMRRQLASELGQHGIRVVTLRTGGIPESIPGGEEMDEIIAGTAAETMLGRAATLADVGNAAVFAASDWARTMTAATVNISCGALTDW
jgi:3-oxoacyl-[acyl-carrier protein] reductase